MISLDQDRTVYLKQLSPHSTLLIWSLFHEFPTLYTIIAFYSSNFLLFSLCCFYLIESISTSSHFFLFVPPIILNLYRLLIPQRMPNCSVQENRILINKISKLKRKQNLSEMLFRNNIAVTFSKPLSNKRKLFMRNNDVVKKRAPLTIDHYLY